MKALLDTNLLVAEPGQLFDDAAAEAYGIVCGLMINRGGEVRGRALDLMIAAMAAGHGASVITRNPDDFLGLDDLVPVIRA